MGAVVERCADAEPAGSITEDENLDLTLEANRATDTSDEKILDYWMISTIADLPSRIAAARISSRSALATRPLRPMTLPMSSGATYTCRITAR
jgi:hypothetical protein